MKWVIGGMAAFAFLGVLAIQATHRVAPVFKAECHAAGGWANMSAGGHYEGCIFPPPAKQ